jgi:hypothetical protein
LEKTQDQISASRGYLVGSPNEMIENLENLEYMIKNINLKRFYAKTIQLVNSKRIIYGATK